MILRNPMETGTGICFSDRAEHGYYPKFHRNFSVRKHLWITGVSLLDGIAYDYAEKKQISEKCP